MKAPVVDWRSLVAHLDWSLLKAPGRRLWLSGCVLMLLSFFGSWTVPWDSAITVGNYDTSGYTYTAYNSASGDNAFTTGAFLIPTVALALAVAYAALRPHPGEPGWLPLLPWGLLAALGVVWVYWTVRALIDANELIEAYAGTNTGYPGGVFVFLVGMVLLALGGRRLNRARRQPETGVAVTTTLDK